MDESSSIVLVTNDDSQVKYDDKQMNTVLEKFFRDVTTHADGTKSAKCALCKTIVKQSTTSTFNYGRHVQRKHQAAFESWRSNTERRKAESQKQPTIHQSLGRNTRQVELTEMIVHDLIIDLGLPLSIVEHPAFLRAMKTVDPRFTTLSRRTLCRESLPSSLQNVMTKVKQACTDANFIALTLDVWSDRRMRSFIAITMHSVTEADGTFQNYLLAFQPVYGKRVRKETIA